MHFLHLTLKDPRVSCALEEGGGIFILFFFTSHNRHVGSGGKSFKGWQTKGCSIKGDRF